MDPSLAVSAIAAVISAVALFVSIKQPFLTQRLSVAQVAAAAIIDAVGAMREVIWASAEVPPDPDVIAKLAYDLDRTCRAHRTSLPKGMGGLRHEVREATGNYLGGASGYALNPSLKELPFSDHERYWWDMTTTHLDYVVDTLGAWRNNPQARRVDLVAFHDWHRDEDAAYHARSSTGRSKTLEFDTGDDQPTPTGSKENAPAQPPAGSSRTDCPPARRPASEHP